VYQLRHYKTAQGRNLIVEWLEALEVKTRARIARRVSRFAFGLFGDFKSVGNGVMEAREAFGPGYRIYFARVDAAIVVLLCGGDKSTQQADIDRAKAFLQDYKTRNLP
jgi:putative addiction module killer protein